MRSTAAPLPAAALWLGLAGLAPFIGLAALRITQPMGPPIVHIALVAYAAVVLTFIGALHWGFAMMMPRASRSEQWQMMGWSAIPAIAAWFAMVLPVNLDLGLLIAVYWLHYAVDMHVAHFRAIPAWYLPLRTLLTLGATLSLLAVLVLAGTSNGLQMLTPSEHPGPPVAPRRFIF